GAGAGRLAGRPARRQRPIARSAPNVRPGPPVHRFLAGALIAASALAACPAVAGAGPATSSLAGRPAGTATGIAGEPTAAAAGTPTAPGSDRRAGHRSAAVTIVTLQPSAGDPDVFAAGVAQRFGVPIRH